MKIQKIAVYFNETKVIEVQAIALDENREAAFEFLGKLKCNSAHSVGAESSVANKSLTPLRKKPFLTLNAPRTPL